MGSLPEELRSGPFCPGDGHGHGAQGAIGLILPAEAIVDDIHEQRRAVPLPHQLRASTISNACFGSEFHVGMAVVTARLLRKLCHHLQSPRPFFVVAIAAALAHALARLNYWRGPMFHIEPTPTKRGVGSSNKWVVDHARDASLERVDSLAYGEGTVMQFVWGGRGAKFVVVTRQTHETSGETSLS